MSDPLGIAIAAAFLFSALFVAAVLAYVEIQKQRIGRGVGRYLREARRRRLSKIVARIRREGGKVVDVEADDAA